MRAFIFEPFRIPSDSMMPTLLDGDFIVVNKYAYGLRWPVLNEKFLDTGTPQRGDVVVFRYPPDPSVNYIKRLVGLPGDRIEVRDDHLVINGEVIDAGGPGPLHRRLLSSTCVRPRRRSANTRTRCCRADRPYGMSPARDLLSAGGAAASLPFCDRTRIRESGNGGYLCDESRSQGQRDCERLCLSRRGAGRALPDDRRQSRQQRRQPRLGSGARQESGRQSDANLVQFRPAASKRGQLGSYRRWHRVNVIGRYICVNNVV